MAISNVKIRIAYREAVDAPWTEVELDPADYFELDSETFSLESVPRFDHAIEYLSNAAPVAQTRLEVIDESLRRMTKIVETFWHDGRCRIIERSDSGDCEPYWELITDLATTASTRQVLRVGRVEGTLQVLSHVVVSRLDDGSFAERQLFPLLDLAE